MPETRAMLDAIEYGGHTWMEQAEGTFMAECCVFCKGLDPIAANKDHWPESEHGHKDGCLFLDWKKQLLTADEAEQTSKPPFTNLDEIREFFGKYAMLMTKIILRTDPEDNETMLSVILCHIRMREVGLAIDEILREAKKYIEAEVAEEEPDAETTPE